jgi:integrase
MVCIPPETGLLISFLPENRRATCLLNPRSRPSKENGTVRFWRSFSVAPCAATSSRRSSARTSSKRDGRWVFVDLLGKGKRVRTVPIPPFVKVANDAWTAAASLSDGPLFRRVRRRKYPEKTPVALSERMIWHIVTKYARETGFVDRLAPHDMRHNAACGNRGGPARSFAANPAGTSSRFSSCWATHRSKLPSDIWDRGRTSKKQ